MSLSTRLAKLEDLLSVQSHKGGGQRAMLESLSATYQRIEGQNVTASWLQRQSPITVFSVALFGPWPIGACVHERLAEIQLTAGPAGKLAKSILGMKP